MSRFFLLDCRSQVSNGATNNTDNSSQSCDHIPVWFRIFLEKQCNDYQYYQASNHLKQGIKNLSTHISTPAFHQSLSHKLKEIYRIPTQSKQLVFVNYFSDDSSILFKHNNNFLFGYRAIVAKNRCIVVKSILAKLVVLVTIKSKYSLPTKKAVKYPQKLGKHMLLFCGQPSLRRFCQLFI